MSNYLSAELCSLQELSLLMLSGNSLFYLPEAVSGLTGLQGLYIDNNQLRELPRSLAALPILARISCCCNPLTYLPAVTFSSRPKLVSTLPFCIRLGGWGVGILFIYLFFLQIILSYLILVLFLAEVVVVVRGSGSGLQICQVVLYFA